MRILLALLIAVTAITAQADGIYKWVDENGVVHFGEQPPENTQVDVIKKPRSERYKKWEAEQKAASPREPAELSKRTVAKQPEKQPDVRQQEQEKVTQMQAALRARRCESARKSLNSLTANSRVREVDQNGNYRRLGEDERQQRIATAQQRIRDNC
ncbi:DUF4124 domain-containing protein [Microbulbifer sp. JMSA004]|uniref:DUF4124 domain-containing protein n=1 Tax=unclassified Microbulbifer TaxID=2619833 RepID=UPI0024AD6263|nr:DUF4124 domain-containing protein [Microbulbifer sp. VAAF005]WHI48784.1 DUF4124 domain-containing protein [Microbulbifer sp. VAAF005]